MNVEFWRERLYQDRVQRDPVARFLQVLHRFAASGDRVLEIGAGAGANNVHGLRGAVGRVYGIDVDRRVATNPLLDVGLLADACRLPFKDSCFDAAFAVYVLEHIEDPDAFTREIGRVLRPGGLFMALTPNRYHYVPALASCTPMRFHKWYNRKLGRSNDDIFPTLYRMNTIRTMSRHFRLGGFEPVELQRIEVQPHYLAFSAPTFLAGAAYERLVNRFEVLAALRVNIICVFRNIKSRA